nr:hypothetical protein CFP56_64728 [Quercus suber]
MILAGLKSWGPLAVEGVAADLNLLTKLLGVAPNVSPDLEEVAKKARLRLTGFDGRLARACDQARRVHDTEEIRHVLVLDKPKIVQSSVQFLHVRNTPVEDIPKRVPRARHGGKSGERGFVADVMRSWYEKTRCSDSQDPAPARVAVMRCWEAFRSSLRRTLTFSFFAHSLGLGLDPDGFCVRLGDRTCPLRFISLFLQAYTLLEQYARRSA